MNKKKKKLATLLLTASLLVANSVTSVCATKSNQLLLNSTGAVVLNSVENMVNDTHKDNYNSTTYNESDIVITNCNLNFREEPSVNSKKLGTFLKNTELKVIGKVDNGWFKVKSNGIIGYVHGDYTTSILKKCKKLYPELELSELSPIKTIYSITNLNIRTGSSTDFEKIGQLTKYESARVLKEYNGWYFILTNEYNFGFVKKTYTKELKNKYVIVDKSEQRLYLYDDEELILSTPVTTGKDSTPSDTGLFNIYHKETDRYLTDGKTYNSHVDYWMPYNKGEGLHDAKWRSVFGTESYKTSGSHGCINIPTTITDDIYEIVKIGTKVLVHK